MATKLLRNRAFLGAVALLVLLGCWEFRWKPQYRPYYESGRQKYLHGDYAQALSSLETAYAIQPNATEIITLMGWTHFKLHHLDKARLYFHRALKIEPDNEEAYLGTAALELKRGKIFQLDRLEAFMQKRAGDPDVTAILAAAYVQAGRYAPAANLFRRLLGYKEYAPDARKALEDLYGLQGSGDRIPSAFVPMRRPQEMQVPYRASDGSMWRFESGIWEKYYVAGVNFGPGSPGYFGSDPTLDGLAYAKYLEQAAQLNANVIRVYTLLPPSFYRAFKHASAGGAKLLLYQQIWIDTPPGGDLFSPDFTEKSKAEIRYVVDALHGRGDVPRKIARGSGLYSEDIADRTGAILLGREIEPSTAIQTNSAHPDETNYAGEYIQIGNATATEVWFARMMDYLISYETRVYNWQHPVAVVNWPPLDPLTHPTESTLREEVKFRIDAGEKLALPQGPQDDDDSVSIDEAKFRQTPGFRAGLFASYHVYPYYPDFLTNDPVYLSAKDRRGPNPLAAYLQKLRDHIPYPLVITEYGIPSSMGISHFHPLGWNHGGHTENQQAALLVRFARTLREVNCAGGIVFELFDEWYKHNWLTAEFEKPLERADLWINELDPEKRYGLIGFRTSKWQLFADLPGAWDNETTFHNSDGSQMQCASDEGFLYIRLSGVCAECFAPAKKKRVKKTNTYAIAIQTLPGTGAQKVPFANLKITGGINFMLVLDSVKTARLLIADNYNPYMEAPQTAEGGDQGLVYRRGYTPKLTDPGSFVEQFVVTNRQRFARDGTFFPSIRYSRSRLRFGNGNPASRDYDSLGEWFADTAKHTIIVRLPWGKLLVTDPSSRQVFSGFDANAQLRSTLSPSIGLAFFVLSQNKKSDVSSMKLLTSYPAAEDRVIRTLATLAWRTWDTVSPEMYLKMSYYALQKEFNEQAGNYDLAAGSFTATPLRPHKRSTTAD
jgi:tetratricopeptide (TPR) repeat protein